MINLITNSIKYNDKKKIEIEVGLSSSETHYKFYVLDNGPGIAAEDQDKIFEIFNVLTTKDRFDRAGNGIGLATVKKIVEKSGGEIQVESQLGQGAKFTFTLER